MGARLTFAVVDTCWKQTDRVRSDLTGRSEFSQGVEAIIRNSEQTTASEQDSEALDRPRWAQSRQLRHLVNER